MARSHVILMGLRGSGKSTVGRLVARRLGVGFVDLDDRTPRVLGETTVARAWQVHGEAAFRVAEVKALETVLREPACVVALGGGTPTAPGAAEVLDRAKAGGARVVYLRAEPRVLAERLAKSHNAHRPSLTGRAADSIEEVTEVFGRREPVYLAVAGTVIEVDGKSVQEMVEEVSRLV